MKTIRSFSSLVLIIAAAVALSSCGGGFSHEWSAAMAKPIPANSIEGPWEGTWKSKDSGHRGELKCVVGPQSGGERSFFYHATWGYFFAGSFKSQHHVNRIGNATAFTADGDLGSHGKFKAVGMVANGDFKATYSAVGDHGVFEMRRPK